MPVSGNRNPPKIGLCPTPTNPTCHSCEALSPQNGSDSLAFGYRASVKRIYLLIRHCSYRSCKRAEDARLGDASNHFHVRRIFSSVTNFFRCKHHTQRPATEVWKTSVLAYMPGNSTLELTEEMYFEFRALRVLHAWFCPASIGRCLGRLRAKLLHV